MWKQTEKFLRNLFDKKLQIPNIKVERAHMVGTKQVSGKRTIVSKFASLKDKQKVLSDTRKVEGTNININEDYSKEPLKIRKENWKTVKELRKNGTYAVLVYEKIVMKEKCRKQ